MSTLTKYLKDYQAPDYQVENVTLRVELGEERTLVKSHLKISAHDHEGKLPLILNGQSLKLLSVALNGKLLFPKDYELTDDHLKIPAPGASFELETTVEIKPQENTSLMGLYKSNGNFCTQCEPEGFRKITYYIDRPDNLAKFTVTIVGDKKCYPVMLSNGNLIDSGELENNQHWVTWQDPFKKSPHLFALVAGQFDVLDDEFQTFSGRKVKLRLFVEPGNLDKCPHAMQALKEAMRWDEVIYGREYDLDIFMTVAVGDFNMGAMENKGLNIFNTKCILANQATATDSDFLNITRVVGHEYFHNWSGNRVGCRDWFQLSLKEGFTVFRDQEFSIDLASSSVKRIQDVDALRTLQFKEDAGPMSHPIRPASYIEINNFYTLTVYEKGAEVIRMMHTLLGPEKFRQATDLYFSRFDEQSVTTDDFVACMAEVSGLDLDQFKLWYSQAGTPIVEITDDYDPKTQTYCLHLRQHTPPTAGQTEKHALHIPVRLGLLSDAGMEYPLRLKDDHSAATTRVLDFKALEQSFEFIEIPSKPTPSLFRGFSAPVKISYNYTDTQLLLLLDHDTDAFCRWEAGQLLAMRRLFNLIKAVQQNEALTLDQEFIEVFRRILNSKNSDLSFLALLLKLPSEIYLADNLEQIDPLAIHRARQFVLKQLAEQLKSDFLRCYLENDVKTEFNLSNQAIGQRALRNTCLSYLILIDDPAISDLVLKHYYGANNMTDKLAALSAFCQRNLPERITLLEDFYNRYHKDDLVLDKWFSVQACSRLDSTFANVETLVEHKDFNLKNPNKVRALIVAFAKMNPGQFHGHEGKPYKFLAQIAIHLDQLNPQMAARLLEPLTHWRRFAEPHQSQMKAALIEVSSQTLSPDSYEIVSKSLL